MLRPKHKQHGWHRHHSEGGDYIVVLLAAAPDPKEAAKCRDPLCPSVSLSARWSPWKTSLLKDLAENRLGANASIHELLQTLRVWRRNLGRSAELAVQLPDPLILVGVLGRWSDWPSWTPWRTSTVYRLHPNECQGCWLCGIQAEAEQLSLMSASPTSTTTAWLRESRSKLLPYNTVWRVSYFQRWWEGECVGSGGARLVVAEVNLVLLSTLGGIQRKGRCWNCSGEGHMKPECPHLKTKEAGQRDSSGSEGWQPQEYRSWKRLIKGWKNYDVFTNDALAEPFTWIYGGFIVVFTWCFWREVQGGDWGGQACCPSYSGVRPEWACEALQCLKAVHLRHSESKADGVSKGGGRKLTLLDGGATHGLRRGLPQEPERA